MTDDEIKRLIDQRLTEKFGEIMRGFCEATMGMTQQMDLLNAVMTDLYRHIGQEPPQPPRMQ